MRWKISSRGYGHKYRCEALRDALDELGIERDLEISDGYHQPIVPGSVVIDDIVRDCTGAALVINPCPGVTADMYPGVKALCGPEYAMVRKVFVPGDESERRNVVILAPGSADFDIGNKFAKGFQPPRFGPENPPHLIYVDGKLEGHLVAWWMRQARHAYVSCSQIVFECARMNLPFTPYVTVKNQERMWAGLQQGPLVIDGLGAKRVAEAIGAL
jgi:hypothetical protein